MSDIQEDLQSQDINVRKGAMNALLEQAAQIDQCRKEADSNRDKIKRRLIRADELVAELEEHASDCYSSLSKLKEQDASAQSSLEGARTAKADCTVQLDEINSVASQIAGVFETAELHSIDIESKLESVNQASALLDSRNQTVDNYKNTLDGLAEQIRKLLPGATSAGLASSFRTRKNSFKRPKALWNSCFIASVLVLGGLAFWGSPLVSNAESAIAGESSTPIAFDYQLFLGYLAMRLPLAAPLVWLALYSARKAGLAARMEEDYAFKEVVSTSFEGYKRELGDLEEECEGSTPLLNLYQSILQTITLRPGRIYEGHHHDTTPLSPLIDGLQKLHKKKSQQEDVDDYESDDE